MKITEIRAHPLSAPIDPPRWTAHEPFAEARMILVELRTDEGIVGTGEIAIGPQPDVCAMIERIAPVLIGRDPLAHAELWELMMSLTDPRPGGIGDWDQLPPPLPRHLRYFFMAAVAGIDIALWDVKGKAAGQPLFRLLGGTRTEVFTYGVGGFYREGEPLEAVGEEFAGYVANGYRALKLKTGALGIEKEMRRIAAIRDAIGPDVSLLLDLNMPYGLEDAIAYARAAEPYDIFWLEEALQWRYQPGDYVRLAQATTIPLSHGEREWSRHTSREFIDSGALRFFEYDGTRFGGFTEALRVAHYCEAKGVVIAPHSAPHIHAHIVSAFGDAADAAETVGDPRLHPIHHRIYGGGAHYHDGMVRLTVAPGFGLEIDWRAVEALKSA